MRLGGNQIDIRENGFAYLHGTDTLAGGTRSLTAVCRTWLKSALLPFDWAVNMVSLNPARLLKMDDRKGKIMAGYDADLVVLNRDYDVVQTYCLGKEML